MKIGFLAMSGIRVRDQELLQLGLTLPGFVDRSEVIASLPSLGLLYLAAVTPCGHKLCYMESLPDGSAPREAYDCDLVAISTFSAQSKESYQVAATLRAAGTVVVLGGLHASVAADEAALHVDHVVTGEGEYVWPEVVRFVEQHPKTLERGRIWKASDYPTVNVAELPVPRFDLLGERKYNRYTVQTSRGCPWRCEFCASSVMLARRYRRRPVDLVVRDIRAIKGLRDRPFIEFADDNTFVDKEWGKALCRAIEGEHVRWFTETDTTVAEDSELLATMRASGCRQILVGLESPGQSEVDGLELLRNFKARSAPHYREAIRKIQSHGITVNGCFILGLDSHTPAIFEDIYRFAEESGLFEVQITVLTPFPGTALYERLLREERILFPGAWERCTLFDINFQPARMSVEGLKAGLYDLAVRLYSAESIERRRRRFFEMNRLASDYQPLAA